MAEREENKTQQATSEKPADAVEQTPVEQKQTPEEIGGPKGPEPTRFGDWEKGGRCIDF